MVDALPTNMQGWLGWVAAVMVAGPYYFTKFLSERRGERTEVESLRAALDETRKREIEERELRQKGDARHQELILSFFEQNATNARLEEQMKHLVQQNEELLSENREFRQQLMELRAALNEVKRNG